MKPQEKGIRPEKLAMEAEIIENFSDAVYLIVADYSGMDMPTTTAFKDSLRENGAKFSVVKNRMLARTMSAETHDLLTGQSAMIYGNGDIVEVAKVIKNFRKENSKPEIKGGVVEGKKINADEVDQLAKLPSKEILYAMLLGTLQAPMSQLVGVMNNKLSSLVYLLEAVRNKKEN
jgi:large subunit ribosomal protein L10